MNTKENINYVFITKTNRPNKGHCNHHSWGSPAKKGYKWSSCCFEGKGDESESNCMWNKPKEFTDDKFLGDGFEISVGPMGEQDLKNVPNATAKSALSGWKGSPSHNNVIVNQGQWRDIKWLKIGAAMYGPFANTWFSDGPGLSKGPKWGTNY